MTAGRCCCPGSPRRPQAAQPGGKGNSLVFRESALGSSADTYGRGRGKGWGAPQLIWAGPPLSWFPLGHSLHLHAAGLEVMASSSSSPGPQGCLPCEVRGPHSLLCFTSPLHVPPAPLGGWFLWALWAPGDVLVVPSSPVPSPLSHQEVFCISCPLCWACYSPVPGLAASEKSPRSEAAPIFCSMHPSYSCSSHVASHRL